MVRKLTQGLWGDGANSLVNEYYHEGVNHHLPKHENSYGKAMFDRFVMGYLASFPKRKLHIDHSIALEEAGQPLRIATRWYLTATHSGKGAFGDPTHKPIVILGITHSEIINEKMVLIEVKGVKFPAYTDQIDFPYFKMFTEKRQQEKKKVYIDNIKTEKKSVKAKEGEGVQLSFFPVYQKDVFDDDVVEKFKIYLIKP